MKRAALSNFLCNSKPNGACLKKAPPLPADRAPGKAMQVETCVC
jgi:hypothetical protein